eukprot:5978280-Karenia_brevis.AAC.1
MDRHFSSAGIDKWHEKFVELACEISGYDAAAFQPLSSDMVCTPRCACSDEPRNVAGDCDASRISNRPDGPILGQANGFACSDEPHSTPSFFTSGNTYPPGIWYTHGTPCPTVPYLHLWHPQQMMQSIGELLDCKLGQHTSPASDFSLQQRLQALETSFCALSAK